MQPNAKAPRDEGPEAASDIIQSGWLNDAESSDTLTKRQVQHVQNALGLPSNNLAAGVPR